MRTVLVVDDDDAIRASLALLLEARWRVLVARDGREALRAVEREVVDAIVLDIRMPVLDGVGVMRGLDARGIAVPLLLLSAHADLPELAAGRRDVDWLAKPFDPCELEARLERLVAGAAARPSTVSA